MSNQPILESADLLMCLLTSSGSKVDTLIVTEHRIDRDAFIVDIGKQLVNLSDHPHPTIMTIGEWRTKCEEGQAGPQDYARIIVDKSVYTALHGLGLQYVESDDLRFFKAGALDYYLVKKVVESGNCPLLESFDAELRQVIYTAKTLVILPDSVTKTAFYELYNPYMDLTWLIDACAVMQDTEWRECGRESSEFDRVYIDDAVYQLYEDKGLTPIVQHDDLRFYPHAMVESCENVSAMTEGDLNKVYHEHGTIAYLIHNWVRAGDTVVVVVDSGTILSNFVKSLLHCNKLLQGFEKVPHVHVQRFRDVKTGGSVTFSYEAILPDATDVIDLNRTHVVLHDVNADVSIFGEAAHTYIKIDSKQSMPDTTAITSFEALAHELDDLIQDPPVDTTRILVMMADPRGVSCFTDELMQHSSGLQHLRKTTMSAGWRFIGSESFEICICYAGSCMSEVPLGTESRGPDLTMVFRTKDMALPKGTHPGVQEIIYSEDVYPTDTPTEEVTPEQEYLQTIDRVIQHLDNPPLVIVVSNDVDHEKEIERIKGCLGISNVAVAGSDCLIHVVPYRQFSWVDWMQDDARCHIICDPTMVPGFVKVGLTDLHNDMLWTVSTSFMMQSGEKEADVPPEPRVNHLADNFKQPLANEISQVMSDLGRGIAVGYKSSLVSPWTASHSQHPVDGPDLSHMTCYGLDVTVGEETVRTHVVSNCFQYIEMAGHVLCSIGDHIISAEIVQIDGLLIERDTILLSSTMQAYRMIGVNDESVKRCRIAIDMDAGDAKDLITELIIKEYGAVFHTLQALATHGRINQPDTEE